MAVVRPSGDRKWVTLEMTPWRDESGEIAGVVSASHDITETVNALRSLERTRSGCSWPPRWPTCRSMISTILRRTVISAGKALFPLDEAEDKAVVDAVFSGDTGRFIDPRDRERVAEVSRRFHKDGAPYDIEYRCCATAARSSGSPR